MLAEVPFFCFGNGKINGPIAKVAWIVEKRQTQVAIASVPPIYVRFFVRVSHCARGAFSRDGKCVQNAGCVVPKTLVVVQNFGAVGQWPQVFGAKASGGR